MKKLLAVRCLLLAVSCSLFAICAHASALVPLSTTTEFTSTAIARFRAYHGETVRLTHRLTLAGAPLDLSGASARFYWRTEEMEDWWSTDATLEGNAVSCDFTPEMDPGTEAIWYFFGITQANAIAYRANGSLTLLDSPGFTPADLGEPDALAAALKALFKEADTRYATKAEHAALAVQVQGKAPASHTHSDLQQSATVLLQAINSEAEIREEADAALEAQVAGKADASHTHTIAQVSNLQTQLNAKAATSTVSALTSRVSSLETEALRLEDAKADALTREATVNNVGSLDPMSDTSMATADQINGLSYQKTTLGAMGFAGAAVKITHFTTFRRAESTDNGSTNMWLRILRHNGTDWTVAYQASVYVTHNSYTLNGQRIEHTMVHKAGTQFIPTDEPVIFCYATSENAPATSFISFGMKVVPASPNMLASGQSSLPAVNDTPGWAYSLAFDAVYEQQVALNEALEGKADAFTVGEGLTLEAGVLSANAPKITVDATLSATSVNPVQNKAVKAELDKKLALTGGTVTGETRFNGGIRTDSFKTLYGTPLLETVSDKGFKFTGLYQFVPYQQTKPFFTAESGTTTLDVTTATATSFVEDGTALSEKYATKRELDDVPKITVDSALSTSSVNPVQNKIIAVQLAKRTIATASGPYLMDIATENGTGIRFSTQDLNASGYLNLWYLNNGGTGTGMCLLTSTALDPLYDRLSAVEELAREPVERSGHAIAWQEGTSLLTVTPNADGAVVFDPTGWPEGQSLLVRLTTPEDFGGVPASVRLVGYFDIEPASTYQLTAYVVGGTLHVVPLLREE